MRCTSGDPMVATTKAPEIRAWNALDVNARWLLRALSACALGLVATVVSGCTASAIPAPGHVSGTPPVPALHEVVVPHGAWFHGVVHERLVIRFAGNAHAPAGELAKAMKSAEGILVDDVLQYDEWIVLGWYLDHGYVRVHVDRPTVSILPRSDTVCVTVAIEEGRPFTLRAIDVYEEQGGVRGASPAWRNPIRPGTTFDRGALARALRGLEHEYRDLGYARVEAIPQMSIDDAHDEVAIVVPVRPGALVRFGRITFVGANTVSENLLLERLSVKAGELYSETGLEKSKQRLLDTGWFDRVDLATKVGVAGDLVDLSVEVDEAQMPMMTASN
jgi:outer membrane protein assembly factor BamA